MLVNQLKIVAENGKIARIDRVKKRHFIFASNFHQIIKDLLKDLPKNDYPVLNSFLFCLMLARLGNGWTWCSRIINQKIMAQTEKLIIKAAPLTRIEV